MQASRLNGRFFQKLDLCRVSVMLMQIQRLDHELPLPRHAREGDAGLDLYSRVSVVLAPNGGRATVPTGISVALDSGHVGLIVARSGLAADNGIAVLDAPGIIDSGYRGEVMVILINHDPKQAFSVVRGDRIAQLVVIPASTVQTVEVTVLPSSQRGPGGLGHTGR
jgi:dUTP pyrophosphatase